MLGTVWIPAAQSKLRSSAGAYVREQIRQAAAGRGRSRYKVENRWLALSNRISSSAKRPPAKARKLALEKFRAKIADPALAKRLTARAARAAERSAIKTTREIERVEKKARAAERAQQAERDAAIEAERAKAETENVNARRKPNKRRLGMPVTQPANRDRSAGKFAARGGCP